MASCSYSPAVSIPRQIPSMITSSIASLKQTSSGIRVKFLDMKSMILRMSLIDRLLRLSAWNLVLSDWLKEDKKLIMLKMARAIADW